MFAIKFIVREYLTFVKRFSWKENIYGNHIEENQ